MAMNVNVTEQQESMVREAVASGHYGSASEVFREALRLFQVEHERRQAKLLAIKATVAASLRDLENGDVLSVDEAQARFDAKIQELYPPE